MGLPSGDTLSLRGHPDRLKRREEFRKYSIDYDGAACDDDDATTAAACVGLVVVVMVVLPLLLPPLQSPVCVCASECVRVCEARGGGEGAGEWSEGGGGHSSNVSNNCWLLITPVFVVVVFVFVVVVFVFVVVV